MKISYQINLKAHASNGMCETQEALLKILTFNNREIKLKQFRSANQVFAEIEGRSSVEKLPKSLNKVCK